MKTLNVLSVNSTNLTWSDTYKWQIKSFGSIMIPLTLTNPMGCRAVSELKHMKNIYHPVILSNIVIDYLRKGHHVMIKDVHDKTIPHIVQDIRSAEETGLIEPKIRFFRIETSEELEKHMKRKEYVHEYVK